jgi:hypothetical protein
MIDQVGGIVSVLLLNPMRLAAEEIRTSPDGFLTKEDLPKSNEREVAQ